MTDNPHLSASQVEKYLQCPKQWVAHYMELQRGDPSEALGLGSAFHAVLEEVGRWRIQRRAGAIDIPTLQRLFSQQLRETMALQDPHGTLLRANEDMERRGFAMLQAFAEDVAHKYWPISVEEEFRFQLPNVTPYEGDAWEVIGRIDARTAPNGELVTIDWKTANKPWSASAEHSKIQATIYLLADLMSGRPVPHRVTFMVFPTTYVKSEDRYICKADIRPTTRTLREISDMMQQLRIAALEINKLRAADGVGATARPSWLCQFCPVKERCHVGQTFLVERGRRAEVTVDERDQPLSAEQVRANTAARLAAEIEDAG